MATTVIDFQGDGNDSRRLFQKLSESWSKRAQVRRSDVHDRTFFDVSACDFLESLLPFKDLPDYQNLPDCDKRKMLTAGWLVYNTKTIDIEKEIIIPACNAIIEGKLGGLSDAEAQRVASETMVDEAYHILLCVACNNITKSNRNVSIDLPRANIVTHMHAGIDQAEHGWQKVLIRLVTAFVSETMVTDYLSLLSTSEGVQRLHTEVVHAHRLDEGVHRYVFVELMRNYLRCATCEERRYALSCIPRAVGWFQTPSLDVWFQLIDFYGIAGFDSRNASLMECLRAHQEPIHGQRVLDSVEVLDTKPLLAFAM